MKYGSMYTILPSKDKNMVHIRVQPMKTPRSTICHILIGWMMTRSGSERTIIAWSHCRGRIVNHVLDRAEITKQLDPSLHMKVAIDRIRAWKLCFAGAHFKKRTADLFNSPLPQFCSCSPLAVPPLTLKIRTKFSEPLLGLILEPHTHALVLT